MKNEIWPFAVWVLAVAFLTGKEFDVVKQGSDFSTLSNSARGWLGGDEDGLDEELHLGHCTQNRLQLNTTIVGFFSCLETISQYFA